jgi:hypothetical protein
LEHLQHPFFSKEKEEMTGAQPANRAAAKLQFGIKECLLAVNFTPNGIKTE